MRAAAVSDCVSPRSLVRHHYAVMGTVFSFALRDRRAAAVLAHVEAELDRIDRIFSPFRADSDVTALGQGRRGIAACAPDVAEVLDLCAQAHQRTDGYFDALHSGRLDPTGLVKGWAVARVERMLAAAGSTCHAINGGGDVLAVGDPDCDPPWRLGVTDGTALVATVQAHNLALATSGNTERPDEVIDPFTRRPVRSLRSVTVAGPDITVADAFATAALAMGRQHPPWLSREPEYWLVPASPGLMAAQDNWSSAACTEVR
jgi:FAD:protein FMN transferase